MLQGNAEHRKCLAAQLVSLEEIIRQLAVNAEAVCTLVQTIPHEQAQWKPEATAASSSLFFWSIHRLRIAKPPRLRT